MSVIWKRRAEPRKGPGDEAAGRVKQLVGLSGRETMNQSSIYRFALGACNQPESD
jgi:hypothetical protein